MTVVPWSTPEPMWLYLTPQHDGFLCNAIWGLKGQAHSTELALRCTVISLDSLNLFTISCMILGERLKFFAILHREMWFLNCSTLLSWNLTESVELWSCIDCKDWDAPFIPKHDTSIYYQFPCFGYSIIFSLLFCLCPNFFGMCCSRQKLNLFIFTKYIYVGQ